MAGYLDNPFAQTNQMNRAITSLAGLFPSRSLATPETAALRAQRLASARSSDASTENNQAKTLGELLGQQNLKEVIQLSGKMPGIHREIDFNNEAFSIGSEDEPVLDAIAGSEATGQRKFQDLLAQITPRLGDNVSQAKIDAFAALAGRGSVAENNSAAQSKMKASDGTTVYSISDRDSINDIAAIDALQRAGESMRVKARFQNQPGHILNDQLLAGILRDKAATKSSNASGGASRSSARLSDARTGKIGRDKTALEAVVEKIRGLGSTDQVIIVDDEEAAPDKVIPGGTTNALSGLVADAVQSGTKLTPGVLNALNVLTGSDPDITNALGIKTADDASNLQDQRDDGAMARLETKIQGQVWRDGVRQNAEMTAAELAHYRDLERDAANHDRKDKRQTAKLTAKAKAASVLLEGQVEINGLKDDAALTRLSIRLNAADKRVTKKLEVEGKQRMAAIREKARITKKKPLEQSQSDDLTAGIQLLAQLKIMEQHVGASGLWQGLPRIMTGGLGLDSEANKFMQARSEVIMLAQAIVKGNPSDTEGANFIKTIADMWADEDNNRNAITSGRKMAMKKVLAIISRGQSGNKALPDTLQAEISDAVKGADGTVLDGGEFTFPAQQAQSAGGSASAPSGSGVNVVSPEDFNRVVNGN